MASENVNNWEEPLSDTSEEPNFEDNNYLTYEDHRCKENMKKLHKYVEEMSYIPAKPPTASTYTENLSKPKKIHIISTAKDYGDIEPQERSKRYKRSASKFNTITTDELEHVLRKDTFFDSQNEDIAKRKNQIYYEMLNKLERQSRTQYLKVLINKFTQFVAKLATSMSIPPTLFDPYARMQRGIFCNILLAIGVQPNSQLAIYYNTKEGNEYEVVHRLSHAILCLIIKALDAASKQNVNNTKPIEVDFKLDSYIKDRIMCAAEKKTKAINLKQCTD
ncbi:uncharacterized protein LOC142242855 [Haematobia irritans]|uniref:uncharacterized protein LOC142242855 n=1 Tax=Haematobia irritans TaxID=7368 RepID=UPI003F4F4D98